MEVEKLVQVLKWPYILTLQLQAEQLTLPDVYGNWVTMEIKLKKEDHPLAVLLLQHLVPRRVKVLDHPAMIAAVYMDPRFNGLLSTENRNEAVKFLENVWLRMANMKGQHESIDLEAGEPELVDDKMDADLLAYVRSKDERFSKPSSPAIEKVKYIRLQLIKFFENETIVNVHGYKGILGYWSSPVRYEYDGLYELSQVMLSVPATQVSVERAFSALRFVLTDYRTSMNDASLENILLVRLNW